MRPAAFAAAVLLLAGGCVEDYSRQGPPPAPRRAPPSPPPPAPPPPPPAPEPVDFKLDDVKGDKLSFKEEKEPKGRRKLEHELFVYTCLPSEFHEMRDLHLRKKAPEKPPPLKPSDDLVLYVLWGDRLGDPQPGAVIDRRNRRIVVTAKWTGQGMMDTGTAYRGYGFQLGPLEPGEYTAWVREETPVDKDGPKLTKTFTFRVEP